MTQLSTRQRSRLPDSAFAYIDASGRRRLPIHDEAHVRNALARFGQVPFEDDAARDRARTRLLRAAKKYGIVPLGFIDGQLRGQGARSLPTGVVTFLLADIEDSTALVNAFGDGYGALLADVRRTLRDAVRRARGREVDARADEFFAAFGRAPAALAAALEIQRAVRDRAWPGGASVRVRVGLHHGRPTLTDAGYVGIAVNTVARICSAGHGGQIVLSRTARTALSDSAGEGIGFRDLGVHRLHGLPEPQALFQVVVDDLPADFPEPRTFVLTSTERAAAAEAAASQPDSAVAEVAPA